MWSVSRPMAVTWHWHLSANISEGSQISVFSRADSVRRDCLLQDNVRAKARCARSCVCFNKKSLPDRHLCFNGSYCAIINWPDVELCGRCSGIMAGIQLPQEMCAKCSRQLVPSCSLTTGNHSSGGLDIVPVSVFNSIFCNQP